MTRPRPARVRRGPRIAVAFVLLLALAGVFSAMALELRTGIEADSRSVAAQRSGVAYLRPLIRLMTELANAQSSAVRGGAVDLPALNAAIDAVSEVDERHGAALLTRARWSDLRAAAPSLAVRGPAAMQPYTDVMALATELARGVGLTSDLSVSPAGYFLADAALVRLPAILAGSAAAVGYAHLAGDAADPGESGGDGADALRLDLAVARTQVATASEALESDLRSVMGSVPAAGFAEALEAFAAAVDRLAAPAPLRQSVAAVNADGLASAAAEVRATALPLAAAVLTELDRVLAGRDADLSTLRTRELAMGLAGIALGLVLLWWCVPARERGGADDASGNAPASDVASVSVQVPAVDARDLLAIEELMHVGRGVRARSREAADDAR